MSRLPPLRDLTRGALPVRTIVAAAGGVCMWGSFPPRSVWFLGVVSLALLAGALGVGRPSLRVGAWCGLVYGLTFWLPLLPWIGVYVGPLPWVALSIALSIYLVLFGVIATATMRLPAAPLWFALSWITVEWARSSFPFGGFPWGAAAFGQVNSPLISVAALGGVPALSFAVALTGSAIAGLAVTVVTIAGSAGSCRRWPPIAGASALVLVAPVCAIAMWPSVDSATTTDQAPGRSVTIAAIQGNVPRLGLDFNAQRRAVLDNHVRETFRLADEIRAGRHPRPDVVMWPENASDIDPLANSDAAEEITAASRAVGAPILVGTLVENPDGRPTNTVLVWAGSSGPIGRYDKHIVQPFGEYLPWRSFFTMFSSYADRAGNFRAGTGASVVRVPTDSAGSLSVGVSTCWEVAFDRSARAAVREGAQMIYVPTNNATFGRTEMTYQQLAMSQVRAVEHGRSVVVAATSGISAIVAPDGGLVSSTGFFEPGMLVERITLHADQTLATRVGATPQVIALVITFLGFLVAVSRRIRFDRHLREAPTRRRRPTTHLTSDPSRRRPMAPPRAEVFGRSGGDPSHPIGSDGAGTLVIIPTYDERENLPLIIERLHAAASGAHVLVVDDGSPDGTGELADAMSAADDRIHVMHRAQKSGLGGAYIAGFGWGLDRDYAVLVEMDADGSHAPEQLHRLLDRINAGSDLVIGSRYVAGGSLVNWPKRRKYLSQGANTYSRLALGVKVRDITAGYRAYRRAVLEKIDLGSIDSHGYCFQIDLAWRSIQAGFVVSEVPITFTERQIGESKMSGDVIGEAFFKVAEWGVRHRLDRLGLRRH